MHRTVTRYRNEQGAVAVIVAILATALLVVAALVVDIGLIRVDRQVNKSAADAATSAGLHALNAGDANPRPYVGVCTAIRYLQSNDDRFSTLADTAGNWTDGTGTPVANGCNDANLRNQVCVPGNLASWARFAWTGLVGGEPITVVIQSGYALSAATGFPEDALPAAAAENDDGAQGCDQLAVIIGQERSPGLGSLATAGSLKSAVRSVGRVQTSPGGYAPAMLLLQQSGCSVLSGANPNTKVYIEGSVASNGLSQPGTIHADSDATGCGNNSWVFNGKQSDNIVAFAAPLVATPSQADPAKPGQITLYGAGAGTAGHHFDNGSNVCGTDSLFLLPVPAGRCPSRPPTLAGRVYREPVDSRYLGGVQAIRDAAIAAFAAAPTYSRILSGGNCSNPQAVLNSWALTSADRVYVNCANFGPASPVVINAGTIVFGGAVVNPASLSMPYATKVYIAGDAAVAKNKTGLSLANNTAFSMHTDNNLSGGSCATTATGPESSSLTTNKAVLVIKNGVLNMTAGQFRACYTTVVMLSGRGGLGQNGCMPGSPSQAAPSSDPCTGSSYTPGTGQISQTGGSLDWTAPNQHALMVTSNGEPNSAYESAWSDPNGPEDLAFWSESANGSPAYRLTGGGTLNLVGVFMIPNAQPLTLAGQFAQKLVNAQFVTSSIELAGGAVITMKVDAGSAVSLPRLELVGLVR